MARLLVYDAYENRIYTYSSLSESDPMPYSTGRTLTVREFRGKSKSPTLLDHHCSDGSVEPDPPQIAAKASLWVSAFRRIWGGHGTRSQHYVGWRLT